MKTRGWVFDADPPAGSSPPAWLHSPNTLRRRDVNCASVVKAISDLIHGHRWPYPLCPRMPTARPEPGASLFWSEPAGELGPEGDPAGSGPPRRRAGVNPRRRGKAARLDTESCSIYVTQSTMTPPVRLATVPVIAAPRSEATNTATSASSARVVARLRWLFPAMVAANSCTVMPYALACSP